MKGATVVAPLYLILNILVAISVFLCRHSSNCVSPLYDTLDSNLRLITVALAMEYLIVWIFIAIGFRMLSKKFEEELPLSSGISGQIEYGHIGGGGSSDTVGPNPPLAATTNTAEQPNVSEAKTAGAQPESEEARIHAMEKGGCS